MTTDAVLVLAIVAVAFLFLLRRLLALRREDDCGGGCSGCLASATSRRQGNSEA